ESGRFLSVYQAYALAKDVTTKRIYIETMQHIMKNSKKVIVGDGNGGTILPYLSLDQLKGKSK
ncbi:MAG: protease modulator HflK, partial [Alphaproteobacteria bacterium]|nr:protease modulator HflK [Alphaproteobacteria bacterium]